MKTIRIKKTNTFALIVFFCSLGFMAHAQERGRENNWPEKRSQYLKKQLKLTDDQTGKVYEVLSETAGRAREIKENKEGDEQKKALWQNTRARDERLFEILTRQQAEDLKKLWKQRKRK